MKRKIGIFPGTFDPVHDGHIGFCLEAKGKCGLDKVYLLPEPRPRGKPHVSSMAQRLQQLKQVANANDGLEIITLTVNTFLIADTLPRILQRFEGNEVTFLLGSDTARGLQKWPGAEQLLRQTALAVGLRGADEAAEVDSLLQSMYSKAGVPSDHTIINSPHPQLSSTLIREGIMEERSTAWQPKRATKGLPLT